MDLGQRLRKAREAAELTQKQLEERSGVSQKTISKIERGDQEGSTQVAQLARACGVSTDWLASELGPMSGALRASEPPAPSYTPESHDKALRAIIQSWPNLRHAGQTLVTDALELARKHFWIDPDAKGSRGAKGAKDATAGNAAKREPLHPAHRRHRRQRP